MNENVKVTSDSPYHNGNVGGMTVHFNKAGETQTLPRKIVKYLMQDNPNNFTMSEIPAEKKAEAK